MKDSFILYTENKEIFESLSDEQAGQLIKAVFNYIDTGEEPNLDGILKVAFIPIRQNLDRNNDKWEETKQKRSSAGKLGAATRKEKQAKQANANFAKNEQAKIANVNFAKTKQANQAVNVDVNVNDNVNVNVNDNVDVVVEQQLQKRFIECTGSTNLNAINECISYLKDLPLEVIEIALIKTSEKNGGWKYAKTILQNWLNAGINTVEKVKTEELNFKNKNKPPDYEETEEEKIARKCRELEESLKNGDK